MILQHHHLRCFIRYCFLLFFALCWVWLRIVTLPSQPGDFYVELLSLIWWYCHWMSVSLSSPTRVCGYPQGSGNSFAGASDLFCFCWGGRGRARGAVSAAFTFLQVHSSRLVYWTVFLTSSRKRRKLHSLNHEGKQWVLSQPVFFCTSYLVSLFDVVEAEVIAVYLHVA